MPTYLRNLKREDLTRLSLLASISKMVNTSYAVDELLERVLDVILENLNAQRGFILIRRGERRKIAVTRGIDKTRIAENSYSRTVVEKVLREGISVLSTDAGSDVRFTGSESVQVHKVRSVLCSPLRSQQETVGAIYLDSLATTGAFVPADGELLEILCDLAVAALERAHYVERTLRAEAKQRVQLKEVLHAATAGKLCVLERSELDDVLRPFRPDMVVALHDPEDVPRARRSVETQWLGRLDAARVHDLALCVSEGATNVVRHGGGGSLSLGTLEDRAVAYFADAGPGIDPDSLPKATLWPGFSTKTSMGLGFTILLQLLDRVRLHSGPGGTHLLMEMVLQGGRTFEEELLERLLEE